MTSSSSSSKISEMLAEAISKNLDLLAIQREKGVEALGERSRTLLNLSILTLMNGQVGAGVRFLGYAIEVKSLHVINDLVKAGDVRLPLLEESMNDLSNNTIDFLEAHPRFSRNLASLLGINNRNK